MTHEVVLPGGWATTHTGPQPAYEYRATVVSGGASSRELNKLYEQGYEPHDKQVFESGVDGSGAVLVTVRRRKPA